MTDITILRAQEDEWGEHPECPVEVLADGSQVWRVPPGTEVEHRVGRFVDRVRVVAAPVGGARLPYSLDTPRPPEPWHVAVETTGGEFWWADWRYLRRLDYPTPAI